MAEKQALYKNPNGELEEIGNNDLDGLASVRTAKVIAENNTGSTILAGTPVREINGSGDGTYFFIEEIPAGSREFLGITAEDIGTNSQGEIIVLGYAPYDTSPYIPATKIYIDFDGSIKTEEPLQDHIYLGIAKDSLVSGTIYLPSQNGFFETRNYKKSSVDAGKNFIIPSGNQSMYCGNFTIETGSNVTVELNAELCVL